MTETVPSAMFTSRAPKLGFVPSFDGIRGIGVMMVLLQHAYPVAESMSSIVDLFFIISGFLITTLLFEEHHKTGTISLRNFYARRAVRLLPALFVVLIVGFVLVLILRPELARQTGLESLAAFFYVHNIFYPPLLGLFQVLGQMWTLSVEEQFYFIVSIAMFLLVPRTKLKAAFTFLVGFYVVVNISRLTGHMGPGQAWFQRPDACALGMILAIVNAWIPPLGPEWNRRLKIMGAIGVAGLCLSLLSSPEILRNAGVEVGAPFLPEFSESVTSGATDAFKAGDTAEVNRIADQAIQEGIEELPNRWYWVRWGFTLGSLSGGMMVLAAARLSESGDWSVNRFLSIPLFRSLGRASYALYISHYQLYPVIAPILPGGPKIQAIGKILVALAVGYAIHIWVERPGMKLKDRFSFLNTQRRAPLAKE